MTSYRIQPTTFCVVLAETERHENAHLLAAAVAHAENAACVVVQIDVLVRIRRYVYGEDQSETVCRPVSREVVNRGDLMLLDGDLLAAERTLTREISEKYGASNHDTHSRQETGNASDR